MLSLAFRGGAALRFLHGIPRYSEDLDFTPERTLGQFDFQATLPTVHTVFAREGYTVDIKSNERSAVNMRALKAYCHQKCKTPRNERMATR